MLEAIIDPKDRVFKSGLKGGFANPSHQVRSAFLEISPPGCVFILGQFIFVEGWLVPCDMLEPNHGVRVISGRLTGRFDHQPFRHELDGKKTEDERNEQCQAQKQEAFAFERPTSQ